MTPVVEQIGVDNQFFKKRNLITAHMKRVHKCESRAKFLGKCIENKVIPKSLLVRAPEGIPSQDPHTRNNFKNAAFGASMKIFI